MNTKTIPHFKLEQSQFEGPLDLLLQLIEEKRLPINEVAIASVTEQFLVHLKKLAQVPPEILADFLNIAGKLLVIKSRSLLPSLALEASEEEAGPNLAEQLILLKEYREALKHLRKFEQRRRQSFARDPFLGEQVIFYPDPNLNLAALHEAAQKISKSLAEIAKLPQHSVAEVISISEKIEHLQKVLSEKVALALRDVLKTAKSRTEVIVTFLALLELIKQKILAVEQQELFADIMIKKIHEPKS